MSTPSGLPGLPPATKWLLVAVATLSILPLLLDRWAGAPWVGEQLALSWYTLREGRVWQLVTYGLTHYQPLSRSMDPFGLAMALLILWMFGGQVEMMLGRRRYLWFCATAIAGAGAFALAAETLLFRGHALYVSSWPLLEAMIAYWAISLPEAAIFFMFVIPLKAKHLLYITIALTVLGLINSGASMLAPLGGIGMGALWARAPLSPRTWMLRLRARWLTWRYRHRRRPFEVIPGQGKDRYLH